MKDILVYEDITGGRHRTIDESLIREADIMVAALTADLCDIPEIRTVVLLRDARLPPVTGHRKLHTVTVRAERDNTNEVLAHWIEDTDAFWPIAPEREGCLEKLCALCVPDTTDTLNRDQSQYPSRHRSQCQLLNSAPAAIRVTASKYETARTLSSADVPCIPAWRTLPADARREGCYIVKPDDGAGCVGLQRVHGKSAVCATLNNNDDNGDKVVQPYTKGEPLSMSLACYQGRCELLSVNKQVIDWFANEKNGKGEYASLRACVVGVAADYEKLTDLGNAIAAAIPALKGYVGVDLIVPPETSGAPDQITVVEINPRLTTAYAGIREAYGYNPAHRILELLTRRSGRRVCDAAPATKAAGTTGIPQRSSAPPKPVIVRAA